MAFFSVHGSMGTGRVYCPVVSQQRNAWSLRFKYRSVRRRPGNRVVQITQFRGFARNGRFFQIRSHMVWWSWPNIIYHFISWVVFLHIREQCLKHEGWYIHRYNQINDYVTYLHQAYSWEKLEIPHESGSGMKENKDIKMETQYNHPYTSSCKPGLLEYLMQLLMYM